MVPRRAVRRQGERRPAARRAGGTTSGGSSGGSTCTIAAWNSSQVYTGGNAVSWNGHNWKAKWWTQGEEPGTTGEWGVWQDLGSC
ncbi:carbohydrate-binding protein [Streptomyces spiralis]